MGRRFADFWLRFFFLWATYAPWVPRVTKPFWMATAWFFSPYLRSVTRSNARLILGPDHSESECRRLAKQTIADFYDFVCDIARCRRRKPERIRRDVEEIVGEEGYAQARASRRGAVLITAHFGSFETGIAALREREPRLYIVLQRDERALFERMRSELHRNLGVEEALVGDGLRMWLRLREALNKDEVVLIQGDRMIPGQKGHLVSMLYGHIQIPLGPIKLAIACDAPMIPVYAIRQPNGRIHIDLDPPIDPAGRPMEETAERLARSIEKRVAAHPSQWHVLQPMFAENADPSAPGGMSGAPRTDDEPTPLGRAVM